jgi:hypothetical protein
MVHDRHFTVDEANGLLPRLSALLDAMQAAQAELTDDEARDALSAAAPGNGGGSPGRLVGEAFLAVRNGLAELQELGVVLRDLGRGLIDFPAILEGREVYLCWEAGEDEVSHWHHLDGGFAGRHPL